MRSPARSCCGSHSSLAMRSSSQPRVRHTAAFACVTCWAAILLSALRQRCNGMLPAALSTVLLCKARGEAAYVLFCHHAELHERGAGAASPTALRSSLPAQRRQTRHRCHATSVHTLKLM